VTSLEALREVTFDALILTVPAPPHRFTERFERLGIPATKVWGLDGTGRGRRAGGGHGQG
jgi:hypothetical protein